MKVTKEGKVAVGVMTEIGDSKIGIFFLHQKKSSESELSVKEENNLLVENVDKKKFDDGKGRLVDVLAR